LDLAELIMKMVQSALRMVDFLMQPKMLLICAMYLCSGPFFLSPSFFYWVVLALLSKQVRDLKSFSHAKEDQLQHVRTTSTRKQPSAWVRVRNSFLTA
jgi:hypothetical protein